MPRFLFHLLSLRIVPIAAALRASYRRRGRQTARVEIFGGSNYKSASLAIRKNHVQTLHIRICGLVEMGRSSAARLGRGVYNTEQNLAVGCPQFREIRTKRLNGLNGLRGLKKVKGSCIQ